MAAEVIDEAVRILRAGGVIGMPTETVYGLAADARDADAVAKIFALKGRPSTNPLIVHVASVEIGERYAVFDERARRLFARFAPGPLTVVLPKSSGNAIRHPDSLPGAERAENAISSLVSAGLSSIGIRIPNHPVSIELLRAFGGPIAAPSANKSNHVSPTTAQHVRDEFGPDLLVLDGGRCAVGIESTVLDLSDATPKILRPGAVTQAQIEAVIGAVGRFEGHASSSVPATSPGQHATHYAPRAPAFRFDSASIAILAERLNQSTRRRPSAVVIGHLPAGLQRAWFENVVELSSDTSRAAHDLYAALREVDRDQPDAILVEVPREAPEWVAFRDRIVRATRPVAEWIARAAHTH